MQGDCLTRGKPSQCNVIGCLHLDREAQVSHELIDVRIQPTYIHRRSITNKFIRHLPVLDNGKLVGIISIGDVVKFIIEEQRFIIENLEHYITGT